jgi:hypothetical protein
MLGPFSGISNKRKVSWGNDELSNQNAERELQSKAVLLLDHVIKDC